MCILNRNSALNPRIVQILIYIASYKTKIPHFKFTIFSDKNKQQYNNNAMT
jgi:hypothetical protein